MEDTTIIELLDTTLDSYVNAGKTTENAEFASVGLCLNGLIGALIEIGQTGRDLTNAELAKVVDGLLQTLTWMTYRDGIRTAWDSVEDGPVFDDEV